MGVILECIEPIGILHLCLRVGYSVFGKWTLANLSGTLGGWTASHDIPTRVALSGEVKESLIKIREFSIGDVVGGCVVCGEVGLGCDGVVLKSIVRVPE